MKKYLGLATAFGLAAIASSACLSATTSNPDGSTNSEPDGAISPDGSNGTSTDAGGPDAGAMVGTSCTPGTGFRSDAGSDPCPAVGLACDVTPGSGGTCQIPTTGQACMPSVGCDTGNTCVPGPRGDVCARNCASATDCPALTDTCQGSDAGSQSVCAADDCTDLFGLCNAAGTNDGTCIPGRRTGTGVCVQGGTAPLTGPCTDSRAGGTGEICPLGTFCVPDGTNGQSGCLPVCSNTAASDAGGACATGDVCVSAAVIAALRPSPDAGLTIGGTGGADVCLATCPTTDAGPGTCPTGQVCVTSPVGGGSYCIP